MLRRSPAMFLDHPPSTSERYRLRATMQGLQDRPAAGLRAAPARIARVGLFVVLLLALVPVVVGDLVARPDVGDRLDEHAPARHDDLAVRIARVVDEAGVVAADRR